jgi:hypothetical protein
LDVVDMLDFFVDCVAELVFVLGFYLEKIGEGFVETGEFLDVVHVGGGGSREERGEL